MTKKNKDEVVKEFYLLFLSRTLHITSHKHLLKYKAYAIQFPHKFINTCLWSKISQKPTLQPMMKLSQLSFRSESSSKPKFKKNLREILSFFWNTQKFTFSLFMKSLLYIFWFYFAWVFNETELISNFWNFEVGSYGWILRKVTSNLLVPSLS